MPEHFQWRCLCGLRRDVGQLAPGASLRCAGCGAAFALEPQKLGCPSCGGAMEITHGPGPGPGDDRLALCRYCKTQVHLPDARGSTREKVTEHPSGTRITERVTEWVTDRPLPGLGPPAAPAGTKTSSSMGAAVWTRTIPVDAGGKLDVAALRKHLAGSGALPDWMDQALQQAGAQLLQPPKVVTVPRRGKMTVESSVEIQEPLWWRRLAAAWRALRGR